MTASTDVEEAYRVNRWGWMLDEREGAFSPELLIDHMLTVEEKHSQQPAHAYWESYSLAERIATVLLLAARCGTLPQSRRVEQLVERSALTLTDRLEYYGSRTNNHLLNDARALYMFGALAGDSACRNTGRAIFEHELPRMVPDGGLREGSSHYHLLIERWLTDVEWAASATNDHTMESVIQPVRNKMHETSRLFGHPQRPCVTIGDVSPDASPDCLRRAFVELHGVDWAPSNQPEPGLHRHGDWCWWGSGEVSALWRLPADPTPPFPTHAHVDLCGFVLFVRGQPVLIDPGRMDYTKSTIGRFGVDATAHSTLLVDGLGPIPREVGPLSARTLFPVSAQVSADGTAAASSVEIRHDGFSRLHSGLQHRRRFDNEPTRMRITDTVFAGGARTVALLFQIAPALRVERLNDCLWTIHGCGRPIELRLDAPSGVKVAGHTLTAQEAPAPAGWDFPDYGERIPATTLRLDCFGSTPMQLTTTIAWN